MSTPPPAPPPSSPPSPPPPNSTAPPPSTPSTPLPSTPATPSAPPPATPSSPPPSNPTPPSAPPPSTPSLSPPPPSTPSASPPPPSTPSESPPSPSTPSASPPSPSTPSESPPSPSTPSASPPSPSTPSESPPSPSTPSESPPSSSTPAAPLTPTPPAPSGRLPPTLNPLPPSTRTPPSGRSPPSPPSSSDSISTAAIVGIAVGAIAIIAVLGLIFVFCCRKKRRSPRPPLEYYGGPPPPLPPQRKDDPYGGQPQNWQHNAPPPADHIVKLPPPPHASRPPLSPPPPPPPVYYSSGGSGSNYSGSEPLPPPSPGFTPGYSKSTFTFEELALATNGFSDSNLLGQGGFGYVHKGVLPNGKEVAIKQLKSGSGQGEREFQAEVEIISRVHHRHLVSLVGYCTSGDRRLLVYEYVPNKTLEFHLHGKDRPTMDWPTRLKIALGSAKGLAYLHEDCHPKIIHRDIKAANILLDFNFDAKVADFGLAKFASDNNTHISTRVMGTFGYLAPEYASSGKLTDRSDVFSYGVMLLELVTGKRPVDSTQTYMDDSLVEWARPLLTRAMEEGNYEALIDPRLARNYNPNEMARMVACAASCVRHSAKRRPRMSQIVRALEGDVSLDDLNEGIRPGHSTVYGSSYDGSTDYDSGQYNEDMKKFRKMVLASRDYTSSEYSAPTSEYGQIPSASSSEGRHTREMELGKIKKDEL